MPGQMKMCQTSVPYFTDMIIMSFACDYCGAHSTETKNTGDVKDEGCIIKLMSDSEEDLKRDLFKVILLLFRVRHVKLKYLKFSWNLIMELLVESLLQLKVF